MSEGCVKGTVPLTHPTKLHHIEGAAKAVDLELSDEEISFLEEPFRIRWQA